MDPIEAPSGLTEYGLTEFFLVLDPLIKFQALCHCSVPRDPIEQVWTLSKHPDSQSMDSQSVVQCLDVCKGPYRTGMDPIEAPSGLTESGLTEYGPMPGCLQT